VSMQRMVTQSSVSATDFDTNLCQCNGWLHKFVSMQRMVTQSCVNATHGDTKLCQCNGFWHKVVLMQSHKLHLTQIITVIAETFEW